MIVGVITRLTTAGKRQSRSFEISSLAPMTLVTTYLTSVRSPTDQYPRKAFRYLPKSASGWQKTEDLFIRRKNANRIDPETAASQEKETHSTFTFITIQEARPRLPG